MNDGFSPKITVFHCARIFDEDPSPEPSGKPAPSLRFVRIPCSSMVKDVFLLRAFEAEADGVLVLVCPEGECRYGEGNIRAGKRVERVAALLEEIGIDPRRLAVLPAGSAGELDRILQEYLPELTCLGPLFSKQNTKN